MGLLIGTDALLSPDIALQPLIEDWVEVSERASVHELVLFSIRCCGLSAEIEESEALDADGARDVLETIQDETVKVGMRSEYK